MNRSTKLSVPSTHVPFEAAWQIVTTWTTLPMEQGVENCQEPASFYISLLLYLFYVDSFSRDFSSTCCKYEPAQRSLIILDLAVFVDKHYDAQDDNLGFYSIDARTQC